MFRLALLMNHAHLVWCLAIGWCFAARDFRLPLGASDEHTHQRSVRSEQRRGRRKDRRPGGLRRKWPGASLLLGHRSLRICSLVAPRPRPFWAQRNTSQLRDTTLVDVLASAAVDGLAGFVAQEQPGTVIARFARALRPPISFQL